MPATRSRRQDRQVLAAFVHFLRSRRIRVTPARQEVLKAALALSGHFEAQQVVDRLVDGNKGVGKATVYRTLPLLVDCGILKQVRFEAKRAHYEVGFGEDPHDHLVCRRCGRIVEFSLEELREIRERVGRAHRFHVISHRFQLSGLCWTCAHACPVGSLRNPGERRSTPSPRSSRRSSD